MEQIAESKERRPFWFFDHAGMENAIWHEWQRWKWGAWAERQSSNPGVMESLGGLFSAPRELIGQPRPKALRVDDDGAAD